MAKEDFYGIRAESRNEALTIATANSLFAEMKKLISDGADPVGLVRQGTTALHEASWLTLIKPAQILIEHAKNLDAIDGNGLTPLMIACSVGKTKGSRMALMLIDAGADVSYVRGDEMTALKFAAKRCKPEVLQRLIDEGAPVDGPKGTSQTALVLAARANNIEALKVLIKNGADPLRKCTLPWAKGLTADGVAEMEGRKRAVQYLRGIAAKST